MNDKEGRIGINASNVKEHAFLQLQLKEAFEINHKLTIQMKDQQREIDSLYKRTRGYLLTQDQLYKDFVRVERHFKQKEEKILGEKRVLEDLVQVEKERSVRNEKLIQSLTTPDKT